MALDRQGNVVITTATRSLDAPTTPGCFQPRFRGRQAEMLVAKLSPDGTRLVFSTLLGGSGTDNVLMPTVDVEGHIWIVGNTGSPAFPVTPATVQSKFGGGTGDTFVGKLVRE